MTCTDKQKVLFDTHMLFEEDDCWWENTCQRLKVIGRTVTWVNFKIEFLEKYFPADVRSKKKIEFLHLKQGSIIVADYFAKFKEMVRFCPHYNGAEAEGSKCVKFKSGLRLEFNQFIGYQEICRFSVLVNKCKIYDEDRRVRSIHYKSVSEKKNGS
ncbi:uncharacterized protein LOC131645962 [Vicia villosa]|uniref:uncharacterized protein LOC131645962 n=1 Tax=Vicia villosa TaxID=3911 RepID=UPI00273CCC0E|nr:uncharacterized protein LOC131645962 [Vicia villosa]